MHRLIAILVLASLATLPALGKVERAILAITAAPASAVLASSTAGRSVVNLPSLEFPVRIEPVCPESSALASVSINVADARFQFTADDFAEADSLETTITVPAAQIAPVTIEHDCPADAAALLVTDVLTAHASLRCAGDSGETVLFEVIGLGVELRCPSPQPVAAVRERP